MKKQELTVFGCIIFSLIIIAAVGRLSASISIQDLDKCKDLFPESPECHNGGCYMPSSAGNCIIKMCFCLPKMFYFDHDCKSGEDTPECKAINE